MLVLEMSALVEEVDVVDYSLFQSRLSKFGGVQILVQNIAPQREHVTGYAVTDVATCPLMCAWPLLSFAALDSTIKEKIGTQDELRPSQ